VNLLGERGTGTKPPDLFCIGLCSAHHRGVYGLDTIGRKQFELIYAVDLRDIVLSNIALYWRTR
jgi:hypothetical protein